MQMQRYISRMLAKPTMPIQIKQTVNSIIPRSNSASLDKFTHDFRDIDKT